MKWRYTKTHCTVLYCIVLYTLNGLMIFSSFCKRRFLFIVCVSYIRGFFLDCFQSYKICNLIPGKRSQNLHVPPGRHGYPFEFKLPRKNLPATFEGKYGYVRYKAKATVSLKRTLLDKEFRTKRLFSMRGPTLDLNNIPEAKVCLKEHVALDRSSWSIKSVCNRLL